MIKLHHFNISFFFFCLFIFSLQPGLTMHIKHVEFQNHLMWPKMPFPHVEFDIHYMWQETLFKHGYWAWANNAYQACRVPKSSYVANKAHPTCTIPYTFYVGRNAHQRWVGMEPMLTCFLSSLMGLEFHEHFTWQITPTMRFYHLS